MKLINKVKDKVGPKPGENKLIRNSLHEEINCLVSERTIKFKKPFWEVERVIITLGFVTNSKDYTKFGVDAALTKGIKIEYRGQSQISIKSSRDLMKYSYDVNLLIDDTVTKNVTLTTRFSFDKFGSGLWVRDQRDYLTVKILEDLSASSNTTMTMIFEGWNV